ncbi:basic leucine zipper 23-like [Impatiens glandulifera]|uniref:basic leucine zipper 23-like n=1 Tax=Impatiens glandulifera TaxID=253017 RepID=UPI001FB09F8D|nr:basic leucine zipper 23-like [Impatiens glandulifera]XP_047322080.1 basic leucine zipper 23-like [Impatiens glandulifera]
MDDGEAAEHSERVLLANPETSGDAHGTASMDSLLDEFLNTRTCTHTHSCNPPGPDLSHTHTCYHTHTQLFPPDGEDGTPPVSNPRKPSGNREAVRKYREKRKAHTAYLEEEVKKLRVLNQQLTKKLQRQSTLESEILNLRGLLSNVKGKIDDELGVFPFLDQYNTTAVFKDGNNNSNLMNFLQCENEIQCFPPSCMETSLIQFENNGENGKMEMEIPYVGGHCNGLLTSTSQAEAESDS